MKIIGLILTHNCEKMLQRTIDKIPKDQLDEVICSDDGSKDDTINILKKNNIISFEHENFGYGGNLQYGLDKAFELGADYVIELHGDGQYDFSKINKTKEIIKDKMPDLILGNRFYNFFVPIKSKMDIIRYIGNIVVTKFSSIGLGIKSRDLFPGYRVYSKNLFKSIPMSKLSKYYFFSFEIIALSKLMNLKICSQPIDCDYSKEHSTMSIWMGVPFILHTLKTIFYYRLAKLGFKLGIFK
tara:strand:+ start:36 stop:758 length:723 start_codon:yes stop_codon:yes gene_type:complete